MRVLTAIAVTTVSCAAALGGAVAPAAATPAAPSGGGEHVVNGRAHLDGRQVVPRPGDPDGRGEFRFQIERDTLCYSLTVRNIDRPTSAHVHAGERGRTGPIVITLRTPTNGESRGCVTADDGRRAGSASRGLTTRQLREIATEPHRFYVDVHNRPFPKGAVRGQLSPSQGGSDGMRSDEGSFGEQGSDAGGFGDARSEDGGTSTPRADEGAETSDTPAEGGA